MGKKDARRVFVMRASQRLDDLCVMYEELLRSGLEDTLRFAAVVAELDAFSVLLARQSPVDRFPVMDEEWQRAWWNTYYCASRDAVLMLRSAFDAATLE